MFNSKLKEVERDRDYARELTRARVSSLDAQVSILNSKLYESTETISKLREIIRALKSEAYSAMGKISSREFISKMRDDLHEFDEECELHITTVGTSYNTTFKLYLYNAREYIADFKDASTETITIEGSVFLKKNITSMEIVKRYYRPELEEFAGLRKACDESWTQDSGGRIPYTGSAADCGHSVQLQRAERI